MSQAQVKNQLTASEVLRQALVEKALAEGNKELFLKVTSPDWEQHYIAEHEITPDYEQDLRLNQDYAQNVIADSKEERQAFIDLLQDFLDRNECSKKVKQWLEELFMKKEMVLDKTLLVYNFKENTNAIQITPMSIKVVSGYPDETNIDRAISRFIDSDEPIYLILQSEEDLEVSTNHQIDAYYGLWSTGRRNEEIDDTTVADTPAEVEQTLQRYLNNHNCDKKVSLILNTILGSKKMLKKTKVCTSSSGRNCILTISENNIKATGTTSEGMEALKYFAKYAETMFIILED